MQKSNCNPDNFNAVIHFDLIFNKNYVLSPNAKLFGIFFENLIGTQPALLLDYDYISQSLNLSKSKLYKAINEYISDGLYFKFKIILNNKTYTYICSDYYFNYLNHGELDLEKVLTIYTLKITGGK